MYFEPLATEKAIATYHLMLFDCRTGGDEGDFISARPIAGHCLEINQVKICFHKSNLPMLLSLPGGARLTSTQQGSHRDPAGSITVWGM